jgi:mannose-1-phosphate guanylyltransferase
MSAGPRAHRTARPPCRMVMRDDAAAIILAGGEGRRLRSLTRRLVGDDRPKQFCPVVGHETLLAQTRRRAAHVADPARTFVVVTRAHEAYYRTALADAPAGAVVEQPEGRGTAPAILYALMRQAVVAPARAVVMLPSDHFIEDDSAFMARVAAAMDTVRSRPSLVVLLGVEPDRPETEYGWIEPGELILARAGAPTYRVQGFREKPPPAAASRLMCAGALWNSFVVVAEPGALGGLIRRAVPALADALAPLEASIGTSREPEVARAAYAALAPVDFSRDVLERHPDHLAVLPVSGTTWNDLGEPARALSARARVARELVPA